MKKDNRYNTVALKPKAGSYQASSTSVIVHLSDAKRTKNERAARMKVVDRAKKLNW